MLRDLALRSLVAGAAQYLETFDAATGRFITMPKELPEPRPPDTELGWAVTNQDGIYALATLYLTPHPGNPYHGDDRVLRMVLEGGDALRRFQNPDGSVEFVKIDGSRWGPTFMPWSMYHWLETYALLRDRLGPERKQAWEEGLRLAYDGIAKNLATAPVHNIPTWNAAACVRADQVLGSPAWRETGLGMIRRATEAQQPGGYWPEHGGPTTLYNHVYTHALGLYHRFTGDPAVLPALERALEFHLTFSYPDGAGVETVDGRVKYHDHLSPFALASFALFPRGRRFARLLLEPRTHVRDLTASCTAHVATAYHHLTDGDEAPIPHDAHRFITPWQDQALLYRDGPWFVCLSALVTPPVESRWGQDRQNFVSVWHEQIGLLVGGGNSREQPAWSTFVVGEGDGARSLPDRGELLPDAAGIRLHYGDAACELRCETEGDSLALAARATRPSRFQLLLRLRPGQEVRTATGHVAVLAAEPLDLADTALGSGLHGPGWRAQIPGGSRLEWPVRPFNPYAKDGFAPLTEAVGVLAVPVTEGSRETRVVIKTE